MSPPNNDLARDGTSSGDNNPDQHRHLHGAVASHFLAQPRGDGYGGETWVDFLREAGDDPARTRPHPNHTSTAPSNMDSPSSASPFALPSRPPPRTDTPSSGSSSDRKRRLTTAESPIRRGSGRSMRAHSSPHAGSSADPIVLDSSPAPQLRERPLPPPPNYTPSQPPRPFRRESDLVLPPWQPDSDVSSCPCSPHRITIPRQFIVHPPSDGSNSIIDLTGDDEANPMSNFGPFRNPALGGGEEVRVCNPCVPDPNYSLPPQYPPAVPPYHRSHRSASSVQIHPRDERRQSQSSRSSNSNRRVSYHDASHNEDRWPSPLPNLGHVYPRQHENSSSSRPPSGLDLVLQNHFGSGSSSQLNPRPRRQIAEEDECPICGGELPEKGPNGDDSARSQHIEECIALHSSSPALNATTRPQVQTSASLPTTRTRGMSSAGAGEGSSYRHSHAARGMFPYIATEKDCVDEDGNDAECVICFEEFQAGDKMARLVCWCKFHEKCIKEWWKMKGRGACPTHQLHEE
ncbi:hypothetical protein E8E11_010275 [Didymella keratinophila]|nr:hypothetical protein E8E11_010275 [Didymella keratinophila]